MDIIYQDHITPALGSAQVIRGHEPNWDAGRVVERLCNMRVTAEATNRVMIPISRGIHPWTYYNSHYSNLVNCRNISQERIGQLSVEGT